ncbi:MAG: hypothetical protein Crog4KO_36790 [Crocinitomicaceae bacterium]
MEQQVAELRAAYEEVMGRLNRVQGVVEEVPGMLSTAVNEAVGSSILEQLTDKVGTAIGAATAAQAGTAAGSGGRGNDLRSKPARPDLWGGRQNDPPIQDWLFSLRVHFDATHVEDGVSKLRLAGSLLRGPAATWWRTRVEESETDGGRPLPTYEVLGMLRATSSQVQSCTVMYSHA